MGKLFSTENINDFMVIFSAVTGVVAGLGLLFIGFIKVNFLLILLSLISVLVGAFSASLLARKEVDEYEKSIF